MLRSTVRGALVIWRTFSSGCRGVFPCTRTPRMRRARACTRDRSLTVFLLLSGLGTLWSVLLVNSWNWLLEVQTLKRNEHLLQILRDFPHQRVINLSDYQLNVPLSNRVPLDRDIPDSRPYDCQFLTYDTESLPTVSIIIPFYNEAWSMLLRSLHSIVDRSPDHLIHEIILVDDNSDYLYLKDPIEEYTKWLSAKIRILRNDAREGLIRARAKAASVATGDVLLFLDAHVECNVDWLPPILEIIKNNRTTMAVPHMDNILPNTIEYRKWGSLVRGGFHWNMDYSWKTVPKDVVRNEIDPYATATTIGCAFTIDRNYFWELGGFDEDMFIWGGENLEMSFRTWMCGGSIVIVPCSRVGHLFRRWLPYSFPRKYGGKYIKYKNYQRVADVWMDEYAMYYYAAIQGEVYYTNEDMASLSKRRELRERLQCKSFSWYLRTLLPDMAIATRDARWFGLLRNLGGNSCASGNPVGQYKDLLLVNCGRNSPDQTFTMTEDTHQLRHGDSCLAAENDREVWLVPCAGTSTPETHRQWYWEPDTESRVLEALYPDVRDEYHRLFVTYKGTKVCLTHVNIDGVEILGLLPCSDDLDLLAFQHWSFTIEFDFEFGQSVLNKRKRGA